MKAKLAETFSEAAMLTLFFAGAVAGLIGAGFLLGGGVMMSGIEHLIGDRTLSQIVATCFIVGGMAGIVMVLFELTVQEVTRYVAGILGLAIITIGIIMFVSPLWVNETIGVDLARWVYVVGSFLGSIMLFFVSRRIRMRLARHY